ncbi:hypothetical protein KGV55_01975 [Candidatus Gracilibacteria bacterium]|nr:hypothetical protein [Candidatus Gracilibacteria bacterium]
MNTVSNKDRWIYSIIFIGINIAFLVFTIGFSGEMNKILAPTYKKHNLPEIIQAIFNFFFPICVYIFIATIAFLNPKKIISIWNKKQEENTNNTLYKKGFDATIEIFRAFLENRINKKSVLIRIFSIAWRVLLLISIPFLIGILLNLLSAILTLMRSLINSNPTLYGPIALILLFLVLHFIFKILNKPLSAKKQNNKTSKN